jgi:4-hydroxy-tetrahydrodipicolinate synthase
MYAPFNSVVTAMVTPFDADLKVADDLVDGLVKHLVDHGTEAILVGGTTGESPTLSEAELVALVKRVKKQLPGGVKLLVGTGTNSTEKSVALSKKISALGVDGLLVVNPYYNKPTQEGLEAHFREVAKSVKDDILLYNIPGRTGVNCEPETIARLAEVPNIVAVKEASGSVEQAAMIRALTPEDKFAVYSGDDALTLPMLSVGAVGVISVASHIVGGKIRKMVESYFEGDVETAKNIHLSLIPLFKALFFRTNPIPIKYAMNRIGIPVGGHRLPLTPADEACRVKVDAALKEIGLV